MKIIIFTGQMFAVLFLFFACSSGEANSNTGSDDATIEVATNNKEQVEEKEASTAAGQAVSTPTLAPKGNVVPPKHATKDELTAFIIGKVNASSSPLSAEQEESIRAIAERYNITVFPDMVTYRKVKRKIIRAIQQEVLTEDQLKVFPKKNK